MALIKTETGFAIEFDCRLLESKPARIMDTAAYYNILWKTIIEAISTASQDKECDRSELIFELTRILESSLPDELQTEIMFENIAPKECFAYKEVS